LISHREKEKLYQFAREIILANGGEKQQIKAAEELGELQQEMLKAVDGRPDRDAIVEEFADVIVMLWQIRVMFGITRPEIEKWIDAKLYRTRKKFNLGL